PGQRGGIVGMTISSGGPADDAASQPAAPRTIKRTRAARIEEREALACGATPDMPTSQPRSVLPARLWFSIGWRYVAPPSMGNVRVLVVEDEPLMAEAIRDGLRLEAIAADLASDGDTALEMLSVNDYDVAVLDRDIPGPSGDEVAETIVASGSGMPILMLTAADR